MLSLSSITLLTGIVLVAADLFTLTVYHPGHPLDTASINAQGRAFYTGLSGPSTYCPEVVQPNCPKGTNQTVFAGFSALWVNVPGGQQIYTAPNGALGFTQAHSASVPVGSYFGGWYNFTVASRCDPNTTVFNWRTPNNSTHGVLLCSSSQPSTTKRATHQVFARTPSFNRTDCVEVTGLQPTYLQTGSPPGVWQYV